MAEEDAADRTEPATPKRLEKAREDGQGPVSREVATFASLTLVVAVLGAYTPTAIEGWTARLVELVARAGDTPPHPDALARLAGLALLQPIWPPLAAAAAGGAAAVLVQTMFLLRPAALTPNLSRISPMAGIKRIFGVKGLFEFGKSLLKLGVFGYVIYRVAGADLRPLGSLPFQDVRTLSATLFGQVLHVCYAAVGVQAVIAAADLLWVRFQFARDMRMSKQDIRDEFKDSEGNPQVKMRIRRIGIQRARRRMMAQVRTATVVVTNPTHYAVALSYDRADNAAPKLVAKGADRVAAKIRELADAGNVPVVSNPPLARALFKLELDTEIPAEHFRAVAQIIAYVWRLRRERPVIH